MKTVHTGLHISESDWKILMSHSAAMLGHLEVPQKEKEEGLSFLESLRTANRLDAGAPLLSLTLGPQSARELPDPAAIR
jgi:hypothetical protein